MHEAAIMDSKRSNKIREIVKLQQILKKWKKLATSSSSSSSSSTTAATAGRVATTSNNKGIKFFKRTLSFTDVVVSCSDSVVVVPKGFLAVCVGEELKKFTIPMEYLSHPSFQVLLREAEEEFGFHQVGVLRIPCHVSLFEKVLKVVEQKRPMFFGEDKDASLISCYGSDCEVTPTHHHAVQTCR